MGDDDVDLSYPDRETLELIGALLWDCQRFEGQLNSWIRRLRSTGHLPNYPDDWEGQTLGQVASRLKKMGASEPETPFSVWASWLAPKVQQVADARGHLHAEATVDGYTRKPRMLRTPKLEARVVVVEHLAGPREGEVEPAKKRQMFGESFWITKDFLRGQITVVQTHYRRLCQDSLQLYDFLYVSPTPAPAGRPPSP